MRRGYLIGILIGITALFAVVTSQSFAGDLPVNDVQLIRKMLLQPDADFSPFIGEDLCDAFIWLIDNDNTPQRERVVHNAITRMWQTGDERAVPYLIEYLDEYPMDCLYNLGYFSTPESCNALLAHISDKDEFNRRFAAQSLGKLDYTVSDEMWGLRDTVLTKLGVRLEKEKEEWILPILNDAFIAVSAQVLPEEGNN
jgi:HEAT repeat protein